MGYNFRQVEQPENAPFSSAMVKIWEQDGATIASVMTWGVPCDGEPSNPDIALIRASMLKRQYDLSEICVWLAAPGLWQQNWGNLSR